MKRIVKGPNKPDARAAIQLLENLCDAMETAAKNKLVGELADSLQSNINTIRSETALYFESFALLSHSSTSEIAAYLKEKLPEVIKHFQSDSAEFMMAEERLETRLIVAAHTKVYADYKYSTVLVEAGLVKTLLRSLAVDRQPAGQIQHEVNLTLELLWMLTLRNRNRSFFTAEQQQKVRELCSKAVDYGTEVYRGNTARANSTIISNLAHGSASIYLIVFSNGFIVGDPDSGDELEEIKYAYIFLDV